MRCKTLVCVSVVVIVVCVLCPVVTTSKPTMIPEKDEIIVQEGGELRLECSGEGKLHLTVDDSKLPFSKNETTGMYTYVRSHALRNDTGWYACAKEDVHIPDDQTNLDHDIARIYVYVNSTEPFVDDALYSILTVAVGDTLVVPCRTTSPGLASSVRAVINDEQMDVPDDMKYDPKIGFILSNIARVWSDANFECVVEGSESEPASYSLQVIDVGPLKNPIINVDQLREIFRGTDATVNCTVFVPFLKKISNFSWVVSPSVPHDRWNQSTEPICVNNITGGQTCSTVLTIKKFEASYDGSYRCHASAGTERVESSAEIRSLDPTYMYFIKWTVDGNNSIEADKTNSVLWKIDIDSYPDELEWKWYDQNRREILTSKSQNNDKYTYSNETTRNGISYFFKIMSPDFADSGNYTIELETKMNKSTINLQLILNAAPTVDIIDASEFSSLGESATFACETSGSPLPNITWFIKEDSGSASSDDSEFRAISDSGVKVEETPPYHLVSTLDVRINHTGEVMCESCNEIRNKLNCTNSTRRIFVSDVNGRFGFTGPDSLSVTEGDDVLVTCGASVHHFTNIKEWRSEKPEKQDIKAANVRLIPRESEYTLQSILEIHNVRKANEGKYICEAVKEEDKIEKLEYSLTVHAEQVPQFVNNSVNNTELSIKVGEEMLLQCFAVGWPKPEVIWLKNDKRIMKKDKLELLNNGTILRKQFFVEGDSGKYSCQAKNRVGTQERYMDVTVAGKKSQSNVIWISLVCALIAIIVIVITYMGIKVNRETKLRKELCDAGLTHFVDGAVECLNPDLTVDDQAELLPYDKKWEFPRESLKLGRQLGSGAFGVVMKAQARGICVEDEVTTVAVKMVRRTTDPSYMKALSSELKIMIHLGKHLNVVNLLGACTKTILTKRELYVIVEYCRFGNLHNYLQRHRSSFVDQIDSVTQKIDPNIGLERLTRCESVGSQNRLQRTVSSFSRSISIRSTDSNTGNEPVDYRQGTDSDDINMSPDGGVLSNNSVQPGWRSNYRGDYKDQNLKPICTQDLLCWAWQVSRGMEYLSSRNVLHGDLAARNILLAEDNIVKICDFGLAKNMYKDNNYKKKGDGPLPIKWMAVESIRDRIFSTQSDVWSFGIVLWEFFTLARTPYPGMEAEKQYDRLIEGYRMEKPEYATDEIYELMTHCWKAKPSLRPSFPELAEKIGTLLNDSIVTHFTDLNTPYMEMNTIAMENGQSDYLTMMSSPNQDFDNAPDPTSPGRADSTYLPMRPLSKTSDSGVFSPRVQLEETRFNFPPLVQSTSINSDSEDCIISMPVPADPYLKPTDAKQRRADFMKHSKEQSTIGGETGYCNVTIKPDVHYSNLTSQLPDNTINSDDARRTDKFQKVSNNDSSPAITIAQNNYSNLPKPKSERLQVVVNGVSNPNYVVMSK